MVRELSEDGPWIFQLPDELIELLALLDANRTQRIAAAWARTDEWQLDGAPELADLARLLEEVTALARQARAEHQEVFVWLCL